ncbi:hypothetical protein [Massilia sp. LjRoot122]|uniref:hypothetical protein n=1 Tax=Massilia sp. LjRoot122 TaxID=3342257 RepID=UPI003ECD047B
MAVVTASLALAACGGGGGSGNTVVSKPGVALHTNAGSVVTLSSGSSADFAIGGGGGGGSFVSYTASSSDLKVATVAVEGPKLKITGVNPGDASIIVTDSAGASVTITVKVPVVALPKIAINGPEKVTLTPGLTSQFKVAGGQAPYSVAISNPNVIAAAAGKDAVSVTAANPGTATVIVYDVLGNSDSFEITVTGGGTISVPLYTTAPESIRMATKATGEYSVHGGTAPYVVTTSDAAIVTGAIEGNKFTITSGAAGRGLLNIRDAAGILQVVTVNVLGDYMMPLYTTAPSGLTLAAGATSSYNIDGGTAPYVASTSAAGVAQASIVSGNKLEIQGISAGVADIIVFDSIGASVKVVATVGGGTGIVPLYTTAPDSITVMVGATPTYQLAGGAAPYTVTSSNVSVATVSQTSNTFTVAGVAAGLAVVSIRDANGSVVNINVTVE